MEDGLDVGKLAVRLALPRNGSPLNPPFGEAVGPQSVGTRGASLVETAVEIFSGYTGYLVVCNARFGRCEIGGRLGS